MIRIDIELFTVTVILPSLLYQFYSLKLILLVCMFMLFIFSGFCAYIESGISSQKDFETNEKRKPWYWYVSNCLTKCLNHIFPYRTFLTGRINKSVRHCFRISIRCFKTWLFFLFFIQGICCMTHPSLRFSFSVFCFNLVHSFLVFTEFPFYCAFFNIEISTA